MIVGDKLGLGKDGLQIMLGCDVISYICVQDGPKASFKVKILRADVHVAIRLAVLLMSTGEIIGQKCEQQVCVGG